MKKKIAIITIFCCLFSALALGYFYLFQEESITTIVPENIKPLAKESETVTETKTPVEEKKAQSSSPVEEEQAPPVVSIETLEGSQPSDALEFYQKGNFSRAMELFTKDFEGKKQEEEKAYSLAYMAKCLEYMGNKEKAKETWQLLLGQYPKSPYCGDAQYYLSDFTETTLQNQKMLSEASLHAEKSLGGKKAALKMAQFSVSQANKLDTWRYYSYAMKASLSNAERKEIQKILDPIVADMLTSPEATGCLVYKVVQGDNLTRIARKNKSSVEMMRYINKLKSDAINIGRELKVIGGLPYIEVYKNSYFLVVYLPNHLYLKSYEIGLGKDNKTPPGVFSIKTKQKNPDWYTEENGKILKIPFNDPRNTLGTRWMGFSHEGFGIHGTKEPESIGKSMSNGCVRMKNEEVEQLFEIVGLGTQVTIK